MGTASAAQAGTLFQSVTAYQQICSKAAVVGSAALSASCEVDEACFPPAPYTRCIVDVRATASALLTFQEGIHGSVYFPSGPWNAPFAPLTADCYTFTGIPETCKAFGNGTLARGTTGRIGCKVWSRVLMANPSVVCEAKWLFS